MEDIFYSKWHKELEIFCKVKPIIIMEGNVFDQYQYPTDQSIVDLSDYIMLFLKDRGYQTIISFDNINQFHSQEDLDSSSLEQFHQLSGCQTPIRNNKIAVPFAGRDETAPILIQQLLSQNDAPSAVIMNFASRYVTSPDKLSQEEVNSFTNLMIAGSKAAEVTLPGAEGLSKNLLFFIVNKTNDIPAWFYLNNPNVKILYLTTPTKEERTMLLKDNRFRSFFQRDIYNEDIKKFELSEEDKQLPEAEQQAKLQKLKMELDKIKDKFIGLTEGFTFLELNDLRKLCKNEGCHITSMSSIIDLYRYGIKENPWTRPDLQEALKAGKEQFDKRVKGQESAITKVLDVVKRAATGMSGLQHSSHTKPKGILFFAGPTGTGKTETAKTLAELLFGDESRCIRFDMSEYSQPQSDQKLLGAPPGYVGYEAGGQLTNAVRENPFSILLFDEIEKAHGSIFDKFLQILEDGRMTDGQGKTVYFSETIIVFTSNLGIYRNDVNGRKVLNVSPSENYETVSKKVKDAIGDYFRLELGRPEILNRIGENIVVFDFIREETADLILNSQIEKIITNLKIEKNIILTLSEDARNVLRQKAMDNLPNGGRGIGNVVEDILINPLSRYMFDHDILQDGTIHISQIHVEQSRIQIDVSEN